MRDRSQLRRLARERDRRTEAERGKPKKYQSMQHVFPLWFADKRSRRIMPKPMAARTMRAP